MWFFLMKYVMQLEANERDIILWRWEWQLEHLPSKSTFKKRKKKYGEWIDRKENIMIM